MTGTATITSSNVSAAAVAAINRPDQALRAAAEAGHTPQSETSLSRQAPMFPIRLAPEAGQIRQAAPRCSTAPVFRTAPLVRQAVPGVVQRRVARVVRRLMPSERCATPEETGVMRRLQQRTAAAAAAAGQRDQTGTVQMAGRRTRRRLG